MQATEFIYVLECQSKNLATPPKYYIGKTHQLEVRLPQHFQGRGTTWTIKYPPLRVHDVFKAHSPFDEDNVTKQYMEEKGIDNVRGGSYSQEVLDPTVVLMRVFWTHPRDGPRA